MARVVLTATLIVMLNLLVGCHGADTGRSQLMPRPRQIKQQISEVRLANAGEADIIEQVVIDREAYRNALLRLIKHYEQTGNNMQLGWAQLELTSLDRIPQYKYIIEANIAGPNLKASTQIAEAELMYREALQIDSKARKYVLIKNEDLLRLALDKYNQLIKRHPSSERIDDAAYKSAKILEYFKDYTIALLYYKRVYQWDPDTEYPAKYRAAIVLDKHLHRMEEALELYQQAVKGYLKGSYKDFAEMRIAQLTKSEQKLEENE